jgi:hypothetical protein
MARLLLAGGWDLERSCFKTGVFLRWALQSLGAQWLNCQSVQQHQNMLVSVHLLSESSSALSCSGDGEDADGMSCLTHCLCRHPTGQSAVNDTGGIPGEL